MTAIDLSSLLDLSLLSYLAALSGLCTSTETKATAAAEARASILVRIIKGRTLLTFLITLNSHRPPKASALKWQLAAQTANHRQKQIQFAATV
jgi:hypothetical protein